MKPSDHVILKRYGEKVDRNTFLQDEMVEGTTFLQGSGRDHVPSESECGRNHVPSGGVGGSNHPGYDGGKTMILQDCGRDHIPSDKMVDETMLLQCPPFPISLCVELPHQSQLAV